MNQDPDLSSTTQDQTLPPEPAVQVAPPVFAPVALSPATTPLPKKRSKLGIWALILNITYYGLPLVILGVWLVLVAAGAFDMNNMALGLLLILAIVLFFGFIFLVGMAMLVLDVLYLVRVKPVGKARVLTIISLSFYLLSCLAAVVGNMFFSLDS